MQSLPTPCPGCEALVSLAPQSRPLHDNIIEVYIRCPVCNWQMVIRRSTNELETLRRLRMRWEAYGRATRVKHGVTSSLAVAQVKKLNTKIRELENEIA